MNSPKLLIIFSIVLSLTPFANLFFSPGVEPHSLVFTVATENDSNDVTPGDEICADSDGSCSLRAAIQETNAIPGMDRVNLPPGTYSLDLGILQVTDDLAIVGSGPEVTKIDGQNLDGILQVGSGSYLRFEISHVSLENGSGSNFGALLLSFYTDGYLEDLWVLNNTTFGYSGGVSNANIGAAVEIRDSLFQGNTGSAGALAVWNATIVNTKVISNTGLLGAGGIGILGGTIEDSEIVGNTSMGNGGGINGSYGLVIRNSLIADNLSETRGGGIYFSADLGLTVIDSTFTGNKAKGNGGGMYVLGGFPAGNLDFINTTIYNNTADKDSTGFGDGGGLYNDSPFYLRLRNSILFGNIDSGGEAPDCSGVITSFDYNLFGDITGCSLTGTIVNSLFGIDPNLQPLADNGGPTRTLALLPGSPAADAASCLDLTNNLVLYDQRHIIRPPAGCDIGAFELEPGLAIYLPNIWKTTDSP